MSPSTATRRARLQRQHRQSRADRGAVGVVALIEQQNFMPARHNHLTPRAAPGIGGKTIQRRRGAGHVQPQRLRRRQHRDGIARHMRRPAPPGRMSRPHRRFPPAPGRHPGCSPRPAAWPRRARQNAIAAAPSGTAARRIASCAVPAGSTAVPPGSSPAKIDAFSAAIASSDPISPRCARSTQVMIATCGRTSAASGAISPGWFMPISNTAKSASRGIRARVSGTPIWLLKLASAACTAPNAAEAAAQHLLGRGLADTARHRDDFAPHCAPALPRPAAPAPPACPPPPAHGPACRARPARRPRPFPAPRPRNHARPVRPAAPRTDLRVSPCACRC